jgi:hypothetical protein
MTNQAPQENLQEKEIGPPPIAEIEVLWVTDGLGCDGDTIAMTAATQPSIEEVVLGALPWIPKVNLHNPFLAAANGDDFLRAFHQAAEGKIENFILVVEGSLPNEHNKEEGYWASLGTDPKTGQPIPTCDWIDHTVRAFATGLLSALGHSPTIAIPGFEGEALVNSNALEKSSFRVLIHAASLEVTEDISDKDRQEMNRRMCEEVLECDSYPKIVYECTVASAS